MLAPRIDTVLKTCPKCVGDPAVINQLLSTIKKQLTPVLANLQLLEQITTEMLGRDKTTIDALLFDSIHLPFSDDSDQE